MRRLGIVLLALMSLIFVGCGSGFNESELADPPADEAEAEQAPDDPNTGGDGPEPSVEPEPPPVAGTREAPLALGEPTTVDLYEVAVTAVDLEATDAVLAHNEFNEQPVEGNTYVLVTLSGAFIGNSDFPEGDPGFDLAVTIVGNDSRQYSSIDSLAVIPDDLIDSPTLEAGGNFKGNLAVEVPAAALDGASLFVEATLSFEQARVYWRLT